MKNIRPKSKHQPRTMAEAQAIIEEQHALLMHAENVLSFYADPELWQDKYAGSTASSTSIKLREYINSQKQPKKIELKLTQLVNEWYFQWMEATLFMMPKEIKRAARQLR